MTGKQSIVVDLTSTSDGPHCADLVSKPNFASGLSVDNNRNSFSMTSFIGSQYSYAGFNYDIATLRRLLHGARILYLCSGLPRPGDFADCSSQMGM